MKSNAVDIHKDKSPASIFNEIQEKYKNQIKTLTEKISNLNHQIMEERIKIETTESQLKAAE